MKSSHKVVLIVSIVVMILLAYGLASLLLYLDQKHPAVLSKIFMNDPKIIVIPIRGELLPDERFGTSPMNQYGNTSIVTYASDVIEILRHYSRDPSVYGFIFDIDSIGGSNLPVMMIKNELESINKTTVSVLRSTALSGGYQIASITDRIFASPLSDIGDIGVVFTKPVIDSTGKLNWCFVASSKFKNIYLSDCDLLSKELKEEMTSQAIEGAHEFALMISKERNMTIGDILPLSDGTIFSGVESLNNGLIDDFGDSMNAAAWIEKETGESARLVFIENIYHSV